MRDTINLTAGQNDNGCNLNVCTPNPAKKVVSEKKVETQTFYHKTYVQTKV